MKCFLKQNSEIIVKMFVQQIGITVLGYLLYLASSVSGNIALMLGLSIFSAGFYLFLLYIHIWEAGAKDKIRIDGKRMKYDPLKGLKVSLVANSLNFLLAVLSSVGYLCIDRTVLVDDKFTSPAWACNMYAISQLIGEFLNSMYTGIGDYLGIMNYPYFLFIIIVPGVTVSTLGYIFGTKERFGFLASSQSR